jgi:hypothetical protein
MAEEAEVFWSHKHRKTGVELQCQADRACYLSFNWNGTVVWEYVGSAGRADGKKFAAYLRKLADEIERNPKHSNGEVPRG